MAFTTKKYTRPVLRKELKRLNAKHFYSLKTLAAAISPRTGTKSAKVAALRYHVGAKVLSGSFQFMSHLTKMDILERLSR